MTFANTSRFAALAVPYSEPDGREVVIGIVKATFHRGLDGRAILGDAQLPIRAADVPFFPDAAESSMRYPSDICTGKRGTDVVIVGEAVARRPTPAVDVAINIRDRVVPLRVHGERLYYRGLAGIAVGPSALFERNPIVYEHAYGGKSADFAIVERRNPVGRGVARTASELIDTPAPTIEHPAHPIVTAEDDPEPVGVGAIGPHWLPRCAYAGTFDDAWRHARMPLMPLDFDIRHNNVASPALWFEEPLAAGDVIAVEGMHEDGLWQLELPPVSVRLRARLHDGRLLTVRPVVDTVLVEPGKDEVQLTLRHAFPVGRGKSLLREIRVDEDDAVDEERRPT